jgi:hypothetical protein
VLRNHVAHHADPDLFSTRQVSHPADLLEQVGRQSVYQAFHPHHHLFRDPPPEPLEGLALDEWAHACGLRAPAYAPK